MSNESKVIKGEKKQLNMFDIFCMGFGGAVGSGIFVLTGLAIAATGRSIVPVVLVGCVFMMLAYFYNILLSSMFKFEGGDYSQKVLCFNPLFTGLNAYVTFINGFAVAMYSVAIINYAKIVVPGLEAYTKPIAAAIIVIFFAATVKGSKFVSILNSIMTVVLLAAIALFIVMGIPKVQPGFWGGPGFLTSGAGGFIKAIALMGWACQGTTMAPVSVQAVTMNAKRTTPVAILYVTIAIAFAYGLMTYVAAGVLPIEQVAGENLSLVAREIFPSWLFILFIFGGAVFAIATSMLGGIIMVRYPILKVAQDGWLPQMFAKTTESGYPYIVYGIYFILCIVPVLGGFSLDAMVSLTMIPNMIMNFYLNFACIGVMKKYPEQYKRSIMSVIPVPIMNIVCVLSAVCAAVVCYNLFIDLSPMNMALMVGLLVLMIAASIFCLKTGAVKKEDLDAAKEQIIRDALASEA